MTAEQNENWGKCPKCGTPVLIDPETGVAAPCSECASHASPYGLYLGAFFCIAVIIAAIFLVYLCIQMLA